MSIPLNSPEPRASTAEPTKGKTILVADDDPGIRGQCGRIVSKHDEEWLAFVTHQANRNRHTPDGCPRVWNLPYGSFD